MGEAFARVDLHNQELADVLEQYRVSQEKNLTDLKNRQAFLEGELEINRDYETAITQIQSLVEDNKDKEAAELTETVMGKLKKLEKKRSKLKTQFADIETMAEGSETADQIDEMSSSLKRLVVADNTETNDLKAAQAQNKTLKAQLETIRKEHDAARALLQEIQKRYVTLAEYRVHMQMSLKSILDSMGKKPQEGGCQDQKLLDNVWDLNKKCYDHAKETLDKLEQMPGCK